jgi:NAD-dependent deacetylase
MSDPLDRAAERLAAATGLLVVTGAGVSAESGIPTFRGTGGLWEGYRAEELATPEAFARDPEQVWRWYRWRRGICLEAGPNPAHDVIAQMEDHYDEFTLATQNVDGIHPRAGSRKIVELHGSIHHGRCTACEVVSPLRDDPEPEDAPLPTCGSCGALVRPHVVWFGESYRPGILESAFAAAEGAEAVLVAGTSARVWPPVAVALHAQEGGAHLVDVNPQETELSIRADTHLAGPAGEVLPRLWSEVKSRRQERPPATTDGEAP